MKEVDSDHAFLYWLRGARSGDRVVYYDGFLMKDREHATRSGLFVDQFSPKLKSAISAWKAYMNGEVLLTQKKRDFGEYEYIATKV